MSNQIKYLTLVLICILCLGCASTVKRSGYKISSRGTHDYQALIPVLRNQSFSDIDHTSLGKVRFGDSGVSLKCNEYHILSLLERDALELKADLIVITKETLPNFASTCYRAEAEFVRFNNRDDLNKVEREPGYSLEEVLYRSKHEKSSYSNGQNQNLTRDVMSGFVTGAVSGAISR